MYMCVFFIYKKEEKERKEKRSVELCKRKINSLF